MKSGILMIKKTCLVKWVKGNQLPNNLKNSIGLVLTNPKEKIINITKKITAVKFTVDVLFNDIIYTIYVEELEKV